MTLTEIYNLAVTVKGSIKVNARGKFIIEGKGFTVRIKDSPLEDLYYGNDRYWYCGYFGTAFYPSKKGIFKAILSHQKHFKFMQKHGGIK